MSSTSQSKYRYHNTTAGTAGLGIFSSINSKVKYCPWSSNDLCWVGLKTAVKISGVSHRSRESWELCVLDQNKVIQYIIHVSNFGVPNTKLLQVDKSTTVCG